MSVSIKITYIKQYQIYVRQNTSKTLLRATNAHSFTWSLHEKRKKEKEGKKDWKRNIIYQGAHLRYISLSSLLGPLCTGTLQSGCFWRYLATWSWKDYTRKFFSTPWFLMLVLMNSFLPTNIPFLFHPKHKNKKNTQSYILMYCIWHSGSLYSQ